MRKGAQKEADQKANEVKPPGRREKKIQSLTDKKGFSPEDAAAVADGKTTEAAVLLKARDKQAANLLANHDLTHQQAQDAVYQKHPTGTRPGPDGTIGRSR